MIENAGRADQQHPFRNPRPQPPVLVRLLQEIDDLLELTLGLVDTGDIVERRLDVGLDVDLGLALADRQQAAAEPAALLHPSHQEHPQADEKHRRHDPAEHVFQEGALDDPGDLDVIGLEVVRELRIDAYGDELAAAVRQRLAQRALDRVGRDRHRLDVVVLQLRDEVAVGDRFDRPVLHPQLLHEQHAEQGEDRKPEIEPRLLFHRGSESAARTLASETIGGSVDA